MKKQTMVPEKPKQRCHKCKEYAKGRERMIEFNYLLKGEPKKETWCQKCWYK